MKSRRFNFLFDAFFNSILVLALMPAPALGQATSFIGSAWKSSSVTLQERNLRLYQSTGFANPIEGMQLRLTPKETPSENEVAFRIMPRGWTEYQLMKQLSAQEVRLEQMTYKVALSQALDARYLATVEYAYALERKRLLAELLTVQEHETNIYARASRSAIADVGDLMRSQNEYEETQIKFLESESLLRQAVLKMKSLDPSFDEKAFDLGSLPSPQDLVANLKRLEAKKVKTEELSTVRLAREEAERARNSLSLSLAEDEKLIDFVEMSMSESKTEKYYGLQVSFNIPGFSSGDYSYRQKARELVKYEVEANSLQKAQDLILETQKELLQRSADLYKVLFKSNLPGAEKLKRLARRQDPLLAVSIEKRSLDRFIRAHDLAFEAQKAYLLYLSSADYFVEQPEVHYLTKDLRRIR